MTKRTGVTIGAALMVVGCGHGGAGAGNWDATDACKLLPKDKVAAALGVPVTGTDLNAVNTSEGSTSASVSNCTYKLAGGKQLTFMARWSPVDQSDSDVAQVKQTLASMGAVTDVPGLGRAAFRNKMQLIVIPDARRYFSFTSLAAPDGVDLPAAEVKLAKQLIG